MPIYKNTGNYLVLPTHVGIEIHHMNSNAGTL